MKLRAFGAYLAVGFIVGGAIVAQAQSAGPTSVLPNFDNPKLQFATGKVVNNAPQISAVLPAIPGDVSAWQVTQWTQPQLMTGDNMKQNDPATRDPVLGTAAYAFDAPDDHSHVWIYKNGPGGHPVYDLFERGGSLSKGGGSNIFLSTHTLGPVTLDRQVTVSFEAKVSRAVIRYDTPNAAKSGAVLAQSFTGFVIQFPSPVGGIKSTLFLQVSIADSPNKARLHTQCHIGPRGGMNLLYGGTIGGIPPLPYQAGTGPLTTISYSLNDYVNQLFATPFTCQSAAGPQTVSMKSVPMQSVVLKNFYIGLETEDTDKRASSAIQGPQGDVEFGLQLSDLRMTAQ